MTALANEHRGEAGDPASYRRGGPPAPPAVIEPAPETSAAPRPIWAARMPAAPPVAPHRDHIAPTASAAPPVAPDRVAPTAPIACAPVPASEPPAAPPASSDRPAPAASSLVWEPIPRSALVRRAPERSPALQDETGETFANTYYDFPVERGGAADTPLYDASCTPIAQVSRAFHDRVCVQGSGRLESGATVSFAKRDCACAAICPRTGQHICYEALDPARFPDGRGATGKPITPLSTVAVDPAVIPLGTTIYIPELAGLPRPDGTPHDGCFVAEDRGLLIKGRRVDIFTGDERTRSAWEARVPSHRGVHVIIGSARCSGPR